MDNVVLNGEIFIYEIGRISFIGHNPADFRGGQKHVFRFFFFEKIRRGFLIKQIQFVVGAQGKIVIDWIDASRGNPLADLARTTILALGAAETGQIQGSLLKASVRIFHAAYIRYYFKLSPGGEDEYHRWLPIVAAARVSEKIPEVEKWLIAKAEKGL